MTLRHRHRPPAVKSRLQVTDVYRLLVDDSAAIRHAAGELVADLLEGAGLPPAGAGAPFQRQRTAVARSMYQTQSIGWERQCGCHMNWNKGADEVHGQHEAELSCNAVGAFFQ